MFANNVSIVGCCKIKCIRIFINTEKKLYNGYNLQHVTIVFVTRVCNIIIAKF